MSVSIFYRFISPTINQNLKKCYIPTYLQPPLLCSHNLSGSILIAGKKTVAEELGIPEPPKKPKPPFFRYVLDMGEKFSSLKPTERISKLSQEWSVLDDSKKTQYVTAYAAESEDYFQKKSKYLASLTEQQIDDMKKLKQKRSMEKKEQKAAQQHRSLRREADKLGRPKHPGNKYSVFAAYVRESGEIPDNFNYMKYVSKKWQTLSESQKYFYENEATKRIQKYKKEIAEWEKKMRESGREDLLQSLSTRVRSSSKKATST